MSASKTLSACAAILLLLVTATATAAGASTALRGATVHPISGPAIEDATVVVDGDGLIAAVGPAASVTVPDGAEVVDLSGLHLYPGFVQPVSSLGLIEISSVRGTRDLEEIGDNNADLRAEVAWNADSLLLPVAAWGGVLSAHVVPQGGTIAGTSAVMRLEGWNWEDMTVRPGVGMHVYFPAVAGDDDEDSETAAARSSALETLDQEFDDAAAYRKAKRAGAEIDFNAKLEGLLPLLDGEQPLFLHAYEKRQIEKALDWAAERELGDVVLVTGSDARYLAERLAADGVAVILDGVLALPNRRWEPYDVAFTAAKALHDAGVRFVIGGESGGFSSANARNLPFHAAMAAAYGLPRDVALRAVTLGPAELLGVADRLGSIEAGKEATFFATAGDPLEILTDIERVWIRGQELDREAEHQWRLYRRYDERPKRGE